MLLCDGVLLMGTSLPKVIEGDLCGVCFGSGKAFPDDFTPLYMYLKLVDVEPRADYVEFFAEFLSHKLQMTQHASIPCFWQGDYDWGFVRMSWSVNPGLSMLIRLSNGLYPFVAANISACTLKYFNQNLPIHPNIGFGGHADVSWK